jgi:tetratricopeptide (TPR) repeat protein
MSDEKGRTDCSVCEYQIPSGAHFCSNCAAPLDTREADESRADAKGVVLWTYGKKPFDPNAKLHLPATAAYRLLGREHELGELLTGLRERRTLLLRGAHGVGKTGLAAHATRLLHDEGLFKDGIAWIDGVSDAAVAAVCDAIASHFENIGILRLSAPDKLTAVYQLMNGRDILLVLNSVKSSETAAAFARNCPDDTALLIISPTLETIEDSDETAGLINLGPLSAEEALSLFNSRVLDDDAAREVCALLDNHPLALAYAASFFKFHTAGLLQYLRNDLSARMEELRGREGTDAAFHVRAAFETVIRELSSDEHDLLSVLAASFDESIGGELLSMAWGDEREGHCAPTLRQLERMSLVEVERDGYYTLHPLLRSFVRQYRHKRKPNANTEGRMLKAACLYAVRYGSSAAEGYDKLEAELGNLLGAVRYAYGREDWSSVVKLALSLLSVLRERNYWAEILNIGRLGVKAAEMSDDAESCARLLREMAATLKSQGEYADARRMLLKCVELGHRLENPEQKADILHQLGQLAQGENDYPQAEQLYRQSLDIYTKSGSRKGVAANLYQLGRVAQERLDYTEAKRFYEESIDIRRSFGDELQYEVAESFNSLALVHEKMGSYKKAESLYKKALEIYRLSKPHEAHHAGCQHNLANLYFAMGLYKKAEKNYQLALDIRTRLLGPTHPDVAQTLNNLAAVHYANGAYTAALPLWQQSLDIYRATFGEQHAHYAAVLGNLAGLHYIAANYDAAEPLYEQALSIRRETLGEKHPDVAQSLNNMALLYAATGRSEEAAKYMEAAAQITLEHFGESHPLHAQSLSNLGLLYKEQGRYAEAESLLKRALDIKKHAYRENHPEVAQGLQNLAKLYDSMHNYQEAVTYMEEAVKIYTATLNDNHPYVAQSLTGLGLLYEVLERRDKAEPLYRKAAQIYRDTVGEAHPDYVATLNCLADLYRTTRDYPAVEEIYVEILRVHRQDGREDEQVAHALFSLGHLAQVQRKYAEAQQYFAESLEIKRKLADRTGEAKIIARLGFIKHQEGQHDKALSLYHQGLEISRTLGQQGSIAQFLHLLGLTLTEQRRYAEARESLMQSMEIHLRMNAKSQQAENLNGLSRLSHAEGKEEEARQFELEAREISDQLKKVESLRNNISKPLDENEIRSLSDELGVNYDDLPGRGRSVKLQELAATVYRRI